MQLVQLLLGDFGGGVLVAASSTSLASPPGGKARSFHCGSSPHKICGFAGAPVMMGAPVTQKPGEAGGRGRSFLRLYQGDMQLAELLLAGPTKSYDSLRGPR